jgi:hypothetical protein
LDLGKQQRTPEVDREIERLTREVEARGGRPILLQHQSQIERYDAARLPMTAEESRELERRTVESLKLRPPHVHPANRR